MLKLFKSQKNFVCVKWGFMCVQCCWYRDVLFLLQDKLLKPLGGYVGYNAEWRDLAQNISRVCIKLDGVTSADLES